jgi:hypothetical protein
MIVRTCRLGCVFVAGAGEADATKQAMAAAVSKSVLRAAARREG